MLINSSLSKFSLSPHCGEITVCGGETLLKLQLRLNGKFAQNWKQNVCNLLKQNLSPANDTGRVGGKIDVYNSP